MSSSAALASAAKRRDAAIHLSSKETVERFPVPCAELVYRRSRDDLVRLARPLGRLLTMRGMPWVLVGASGPVADLAGWYFRNKLPMYFKGANPPQPGDLAYTEVALFGL